MATTSGENIKLELKDELEPMEDDVDNEPNFVIDEPSSRSESSAETVDPDVKLVVDKLCEDVVRAEEEDDFVQCVTSIGDLKIKVNKKHAEIAKHFGFDSFNFICMGPPLLSKSAKEQETFARASSSESSESLQIMSKKMRGDKQSSKLSMLSYKKESSKRNKGDKISLNGSVSTHEKKHKHEKKRKEREDEQKASSMKEEESRKRVREMLADKIRTRCAFHDIDISEKKIKELSYQVEYDLLELIKSTRDSRYRNWLKIFVKFIINSGKVFLDKLISGTATIPRLVRIPDTILDGELHKMDEIEAAIVNTVNESITKIDIQPLQSQTPPVANESISNNNNDVVRPKPQPKQPLKFKAEMFKSTIVASKPELARSAVDDILGGDATDTTSKHMSHLYDANCRICKQKSQMETAMMEKIKKNNQEKEKERERKQKRKESREEFDSFSPGGGGDFDLDFDSSHKHRRSKSPERIDRFSSYSARKQRRSRSPNRYDRFDLARKRRRSRSRTPPGRFEHESFHRNRYSRSPPPTRFDSNSSHRRRYSRSRSRSPPFENLSPPGTGPSSFRPSLSSFLDRPESDFNNSLEKRSESWRQPAKRQKMSPEHNPLSNQIEKTIWSGMFIYQMLKFKCEFLLIKNIKAALNLEKSLPKTMTVQGLIECNTVWTYLESLRNAWTKNIITLLMHPPIDDKGYKDYVTFYQYLQQRDRMTVIDVSQCLDLKDIYFYAQPAFTNLPPSCDVGDGPGLANDIQQCGNIIAIVVRNSILRNEKVQELKASPVLNRMLVEKTPELIEKIVTDAAPLGLTKKPFFDDIPIVEKSPFDDDDMKNMFNSFPQENTKSMERLPFERPVYQTSEPSFSESINMSQVTNDNMEISSDNEDGEIVSPNGEFLPPPPPPPDDLHDESVPPPPPPMQTNSIPEIFEPVPPPQNMSMPPMGMPLHRAPMMIPNGLAPPPGVMRPRMRMPQRGMLRPGLRPMMPRQGVPRQGPPTRLMRPENPNRMPLQRPPMPNPENPNRLPLGRPPPLMNRQNGPPEAVPPPGMMRQRPSRPPPPNSSNPNLMPLGARLPIGQRPPMGLNQTRPRLMRMPGPPRGMQMPPRGMPPRFPNNGMPS